MVIDVKLNKFFPEYESPALDLGRNIRQPARSVLSDDILLTMKHEIDNDFKVLSEQNDISRIIELNNKSNIKNH